MSIFEPSSPQWTSRMLAIFRIVAGLMFLWAGSQKLFGWPKSPVEIPPFGLLSQLGIGALMELIGGFLIVIGFLTRPVAFLLAGEMAVAYFQFHQPMGALPNTNQGIPAVLYCFLFLYLMVAGAGAWSVDEAIARSRATGRSRAV